MAFFIALVHDDDDAAHRPSTPTIAVRCGSAPKATAAICQGTPRRARRAALHIPLLINTARTAGPLSLAVRVVGQHGDA